MAEVLAFDTGYDARIIGLGIALAIGFVIGIEREWAEDKPVGVRSFALIAAFGGLCALLLPETGGWSGCSHSATCCSPPPGRRSARS